MAGPAITNFFFNPFAVDVVGVYDDAFRQVFRAARPMEAVIKQSEKVMQHPVEDGSTITDNVIILPIEIELTVFLPSDIYMNTYAQIQGYFLKSSNLTVQTRVGTYTNMILEDMPHKEEPDRFNIVTMVLKLQQVQFVTAQYQTLPPTQVANPTDASTAQLGQQSAVDASVTQVTLANATYSKNLTGIELAGVQ